MILERVPRLELIEAVLDGRVADAPLVTAILAHDRLEEPGTSVTPVERHDPHGAGSAGSRRPGPEPGDRRPQRPPLAVAGKPYGDIGFGLGSTSASGFSTSG